MPFRGFRRRWIGHAVARGASVAGCEERLRPFGASLAGDVAASHTLRSPVATGLPGGTPLETGQPTVGYGVRLTSRVVLALLAEPEGSLAPSPLVTSPRRGTTSEMGGLARVKSWDIGFPTALPTFAPALARARSSSRTFARAAREWVNTRPRDPPGLQRRLARHLPLPSIQPVTRSDCLSWDCPKIAPPSSLTAPESTPGRPLAGPPFGGCVPPHPRVPPAWFLTTSAASSSDTRRMSCNALRPWGSSRFRTADEPGRPDSPPRPSPGCLPCPPKPSLRS